MRGLRGCREVLGAFLLGVLGAAQSGPAAEVRAVLGTAYDSNLFEAAARTQGGWVSRFYVASSGYLLRRSKGHLRMQHQGGIKRFWEGARDTTGAGEVVANIVTVAGLVRVARRVVLGGTGEMKLKNVSRVPGEESYLRGMVEGRAVASLGKGASATLRYRRGGDETRDALLPEVSLHEVGVTFGYGRSRRLRGQAGVAWRWLDYGRPALEMGPDGEVAVLKDRQSDLLRQASAGVQVYRGMLVHLTYGFLDNRSNSFGYGFRAHRFQVLVVRHIAGGVDGQAYVNLQVRTYRHPLTPLPGGGSAADEYEQTMAVLKLSRQITDRWGMSLQYGFYRNGARRSGAFYRKQVYTLSVETSL